MILVMVCLLLGCTVSVTYTTTFHVKDQAGQALAGATIAITGYTSTPTTTGADGIVTFELPNGVYPATITAPAGYTSPSPISVTVNNAAQTVEVPLSSIPSSKK